MMHAEPRPSSTPELETFFELSSEMLAMMGFGGLLEAVNPAWETVLGFSPDGLRGSLFLDLIHPEDEERARTALLSLAHGGPSASLKLRTRHRDGGHVWVNWRLSAAVDKRLYYLAGHNGTAPHAEDTRQLSELGLVAAVVAHDFNNVLSVVRGCAAMLRALADPASPLLDEIAALEKATRHGADLVDQVLAHSGQPAPPAGLIDPNEAIAQMDWLLRRLVPKNISLDVLLAPGLGRIAADAAPLREAVVNLVLNARDAMREGGRLSIETARAVVGPGDDRTQPPLPPGDYVRVSVTDTGPGLPPEMHARLFEPFRTSKPSGTGLGLYAVRQTAQRFGGHVRFRSRPGATSFEIYLPRPSA